MVQKSGNISSTVYSKTSRVRSPDSAVWGSTKAKNLVSGVKFSWDRYQKLYFVEFLETVGLGFKNADISPLLVQLNLDGYEDINNDHGENVYDIIEEKVRRKIKNTADELGAERLKKASFGSKKLDSTSTGEPVPIPNNTVPSQPETPRAGTKTPAGDLKPILDFPDKSDSERCDTPTQPTKSPQTSHPFLRMPKQKAPMPPPSPSSSGSSYTLRHDINFEPKPLPAFSFKGSQNSSSSPSTPQRIIKFEPSDHFLPSLEFKDSERSSQSPTSKAASSDKTDEESTSKRGRAKRSIGRLVSLLKRAEDALDEVEAAFDDLPQVEEGGELARTIARLRSEFNGVQVDAEEVEDFAAERLSG
ncbi:uncharacterized protein GGS22DRAFT_188187 [Annulohypoxylon maeteangense]|uniref:uncharacterized protein n=1 Tax=Annulohypoxylon maeteangense TaxID=1927788 RepID=UPI002007A8FC|nr:uncharacterized protein GGS22DRAFT_188187 [Annulohypoxylon maeteangense]KAI0885899.1 hypothetical protein GGS22DRAFT_188187 [Annulohypoxylon maeteangense]